MSREDTGNVLDDVIGIPLETIQSDIIFDLNSDRTDYQAKLTDFLNKYDRTPVKVDINGFYEIFKTIVGAKLIYEGAPADQLFISRDFPEKEQLNRWNEIITFTMNGRRFARTDASSPYETPKRSQLKPLLRKANLPDPTSPGNVLDMYDLRFENSVIFTCWAKTCEEADFRARWLEDLMLDFSYYFGANGVDSIAYLGRAADVERFVQPGELRHIGCPMHYWVRTVKQYLSREKMVDEIVLSLQVKG